MALRRHGHPQHSTSLNPWEQRQVQRYSKKLEYRFFMQISLRIPVF
jgi:hypothetical protein